MTQFDILPFHHANLKDGTRPRKVYVVRGTISHWVWNEPTKCVLLYTIGGPIPVAENFEEINKVFSTEVETSKETTK